MRSYLVDLGICGVGLGLNPHKESRPAKKNTMAKEFDEPYESVGPTGQLNIPVTGEPTIRLTGPI